MRRLALTRAHVSRSLIAILVFGLLLPTAPVAAGESTAIDISSMSKRERALHNKTLQDGWELHSYSKVEITFAVAEDGQKTPIRQEVIAGPGAGTVEECTDCFSIFHHNGKDSLEISVAAYRHWDYPSHWNFHGHFRWLDTQDTVNLNDDFVSLAWSGNQALDWHGLHLFWEGGTDTLNDFYLQEVSPSAGIVLGFEEWKPWSVFGAYQAAEEGFASVLVHQNVYNGLAGNVAFTYHHTWESVSTNFTIQPGTWPSVSFGFGTGKWEKATYSGFTY